ncbi:hypothetical protein I6A60_24735 [Frankia sp. AgB1.9]|uniref:hypothetical protein n=1 Tax=unclassified Frankia TaxID=2632575 RepID=UPI0019324288|nr:MULTISPECIES: hypothetical protein [unclassified Frankia]MBL7487435.1 hypothetical protein [Frankia sp. AgW1.1]MBL7551047.1 hypothetical protein [Frankia sp. AgB1.9]MBL7618828.1 hypothetical protein [Frankia sp. AgB1.8]
MTTRRTPHPTQGDAGTISLTLAVLFAGALILAGLIFDAGHVLDTAGRASDLAAAAARAGAQALDETSLRAGTPALDRTRADANVHAYLARHPEAQPVAVIVDGLTVTVTVTERVDFQLLALTGHSHTTVVETRTATAATDP